MPTYEYKCEPCDNITEKQKSFSESNSVEICEKCGGEMKKHFGTFGIQFKGPGFYKTDNPK
jgi:putative FmdB family regulatory protein